MGWGRFTLIKSTMANILIYYISLITIPVSVTKRLESVECRFLWGDLEEKRNYYLVVWYEVKKPIHLGELGLMLMVEVNRVFQGK